MGRNIRWRLFLLMLGWALLLLLTVPNLIKAVRRGSERAQARPVQAREDLYADEKLTIELFKKSRESVVYITTLVYQQDIFSFNVMEIPQGTGSGFIWDKAGHVVTNFHVIQQAQNVVVTLSDQSKWRANLVGVDADKDVAVLKIAAPVEKLKPIPIGSSKELIVGQRVYAIGNPFGLDQTLTMGIISALGREIHSITRRPIQGVIQTDAAINPGNSGGPLLDSAGRCIGVNTAIYSPSGAYAGVGFAVPVDIINRLVPQIINYGKVTRPGLGIQIAEDYIANQLGIQGVLVMDITRGSSAEKAGLKPTRRDRNGDILLGDIIVSVDGKITRSVDDLYKVLEQYEVGDSVTVEIVRDQKRRTINIALQGI